MGGDICTHTSSGKSLYLLGSGIRYLKEGHHLRAHTFFVQVEGGSGDFSVHMEWKEGNGDYYPQLATS